MSDAQSSDRVLARECAVLSRYLVGLDPDSSLVEKYASFEQGRAAAGVADAASGFDRYSLRLLRLGPFAAGLVDSYTSRFRRGGPAFRKLVAMLGLLECRPASSELLARPDSGGAVLVVARLMVRGVAELLSLLLSVALLGPVQLLDRLRGPGP